VSARSILENIFSYWDRNRRCGHTKAQMAGAAMSIEGVATRPMFLVASELEADGYRRKFGIDSDSIYSESLLGHVGRPLVVDHYAMASLVKEALRNADDATDSRYHALIAENERLRKELRTEHDRLANAMREIDRLTRRAADSQMALHAATEGLRALGYGLSHRSDTGYAMEPSHRAWAELRDRMVETAEKDRARERAMLGADESPF
jgi:hypothetical protein